MFDGLEDDGEQARTDQQGPMHCMVESEGRHCVSEFGHKGHHRFRFILPSTEGLD